MLCFDTSDELVEVCEVQDFSIITRIVLPWNKAYTSGKFNISFLDLDQNLSVHVLADHFVNVIFSFLWVVVSDTCFALEPSGKSGNK